ncbi:uncharacterized protein LOC133848665 [Drosophila sulfurigaster albostrigata]|uniref:uncharacterized protein LOC133848665 n=1 Tax=Drosophila sulfurigaster albostrigata TaxID=89887 RepID=UPI002D21C264|nr:uncharacterized protein LOC133848665 [Drosophila sulfurigaster albostrigata]
MRNASGKIVAKSPSLEILDITRMNLGMDFFSSNRRLKWNVMHYRRAPLTVFYAYTDQELIRRYFTHPRVQLIPDHKIQKPLLGFIIQLELTPLDEELIPIE